MSKKKSVKKAVKHSVKKVVKSPKKQPKNPQELFGDWWEKVAQKQVNKIERDWLKDTKPNDPDEDAGGDSWHVNQMMHDGEAHNMTYDIAEGIFILGLSGEKWEMSMGDSLFCELDDVILQAYEAGKKCKQKS